MPLEINAARKPSARSLPLHRALRRVTWSAHQPMNTLKLFTLKLLKMLRHVSIIRSSSGSCLFLAKITLLKTFTAWFSYNNLVTWQHVVLCRSSVARSFNVNNLSVCIGWCADQVIHEWRSAAKVVRVIESKKRRWAGCGVCIGGTRNPYRMSVTKPESRNHCGDLDN